MPRLSVNINEETAEALQQLADGHGISITEAIRRAVGVYWEITRIDTNPNKRLEIHDRRHHDCYLLNL